MEELPAALGAGSLRERGVSPSEREQRMVERQVLWHAFLKAVRPRGTKPKE